MLTRRDWLKLLLAAPIAATVDVEKLLWVPKPIITVPALPLILRDSATGIAIRFVKQWHIQTDKQPHRIDWVYLAPDQPDSYLTVR